jgi:uncharacterized protein (DUF58 family)
MRASTSVQARLRAWFRLPRVIRPAREGWWYLSVTMAVGVAATNTGNNLLYLILSMLLAGIIVSGLLSEQTLRGVAVRRELARPLFAGQPAFGRVLVANRKRRLRSFSLRIRQIDPNGTPSLLAYLPHLAPASEAQTAYKTRFERRGLVRLPAIQTTTGFPFGLFVKATQPQAGEEVLVLPRIVPLPADLVQALDEAGVSARPVRGPGADLHDLRPFRVGDDPRLIHWKQSAKLDRPMVKELESEEGGRITLILVDPTPSPQKPDELERLEQDITFVASLAAHLLQRGGEIEVRDRGGRQGALRGEAGLFHLLEHLARYEPPDSVEAPGPVGAGDGAPHEATTVTVWLGRGLVAIPGSAGEGGRLVRVALPPQEMTR